ncbi:MAG: hypothetical protein NVSMB54_08050 [Ktedonobacteraceae bacterium]
MYQVLVRCVMPRGPDTSSLIVVGMGNDYMRKASTSWLSPGRIEHIFMFAGIVV